MGTNNAERARGRRALVGSILALLMSAAVLLAVLTVLQNAGTTRSRGGQRASASGEIHGAGTAGTMDLIRELGSRGIVARPSSNRCANGFIVASGRGYALGGGGRSGFEYVCVYLYPDPSSAKAAAERIPAEAEMPAAEWDRDTHFFRCGRVLAVYSGYDERNLRALTELCGGPFAFGEGFGPDE